MITRTLLVTTKGTTQSITKQFESEFHMLLYVTMLSTLHGAKVITLNCMGRK